MKQVKASAFDITISTLKNTQHEFSFVADETLFEGTAHTSVEKAQLKIALVLDKSETMLHLHFNIEGSLTLLCDRSLEPFEHSIAVKQQLIWQFGDTPETITDELEIIDRQTAVINVSQPIYEFVLLAIPMKKLHPRFRNEADDDTVEETLIYSSENTPASPDEDSPIDSRWEALRKLKNSQSN